MCTNLMFVFINASRDSLFTNWIYILETETDDCAVLASRRVAVIRGIYIFIYFSVLLFVVLA